MGTDERRIRVHVGERILSRQQVDALDEYLRGLNDDDRDGS